jgi:TolB-like protein/tetratricopeptide (TPR) repeat protein
MASALEAGARVGPYEIVGLLGAGGMGEVYRARDTRLGRDVAIKVLPAAVAEDPGRLSRFAQEARATAALSHPNIVALHDIGEHDGHPFLVSELLVGQSLRERLAAGPLLLLTTINYARQIVSGLAAAHTRGVVHRDLKPDNLFVTTDDRVKILDFGLAKLTTPLPGASTTLTAPSSGLVAGTAGYMSPEQARGQSTDARSDIFSMGAVLYEMVTGRHAFTGDSAADVVSAVLTTDPPPLSHVVPGIPGAIEAIVGRCLQKEPGQRFQSAGDLGFALDAVSPSGPGAAARLPRRPASSFASTFARRRTPTVATALIVMTVGLGIGGWRLWPTPPEAAAPAAGVTDMAARRVIAVLPFKSLSADTRQDYFAAGVSEEIHRRLSEIGTFRLLGRSAISDPQAGDVRRLAAEFGAGSLVEGSVRVERDRVRISVALVDTRTDRSLWSQVYERNLRDIFAVQTDVALRVADALDLTLTAEQRWRVERKPTDNPAAYDLYLRAHGTWTGTREDDESAVGYLSEAVRLDPKFALAQAFLAYRMMFLSVNGDVGHLDRALDIARRAIAIDPTMSVAHMALASLLSEKGLASGARKSFLRALTLDPNNVWSMNNLSRLEIVMGRYDEAFLWALRAFRLQPRMMPFHLAEAVLMLDDPETDQWLRTVCQRYPLDPRMTALSVRLDASRGKLPGALARARKLAIDQPGNPEVLALLAELAYASSAKGAEALAESNYRASPDGRSRWLAAVSPRVRYAALLARGGRRAQALRLASDAISRAERLQREGVQSPDLPLDIAAAHTIQGDHSVAVEWLDRAFAAGFRDYRTLRIDPVFEPLRGDARFQELVNRMNTDLAAMRKRADLARSLPALGAR